MPCPFHREDKPSMSVNIETGVFFCFGCHKKGWINEIIADLEDISLSEAFRIVREVKIVSRKGKKEGRQLKVLDESLMDDFPSLQSGDYIDYLGSRGISVETAIEYGLREGMASDRDWSWRIVVPVRDLSGNLVSIEGRLIDDDLKGSRYFKLKGSRANMGMFGIDKVDSGNDILYVVEGFFDCLSLVESDYPSVGMGCSDISERQMLQLRKVTKYPVVILDGHSKEVAEDRKKVVRGLSKKLSAHFKQFEIFEILDEDKDPNDLFINGELDDFMDEVWNKLEVLSV
jgi:DNA primase